MFCFLLACFPKFCLLKVWVNISDFILVFLDFLNTYVHVFDQIWEALGHYFFKCSTPFSLVGHLWFLGWFACWCPTDLLSWGHFSSVFLFLVLRVINFCCPVFKFTDPSCSNLLLNRSSQIFTLVTALLSCKISFGFIWVFYLYFHFVYTSWLSLLLPLVLNHF